MAPYVVLIIGPHRVPLGVETIDCDSDEEAVRLTRERANVRQARGYEIWVRGVKLASFFSRSVHGEPARNHAGADL